MGQPGNGNIAAHLPAMARALPDRLAVAVQGPRGANPAYGRYNFAELEAESNRIAHGLAREGIGRGVRTVLMVKPGLDFFALVFALFKTGAVPVMVDPGMGIRNLRTCLDEAKPEAFIGIPKAHAARVLLGWGRGSIRTLVTVGRRLGWGGTTLAALRGGGGETFDPVAPEPGETAAILFTSGSTGVPKGAVYTHAMFNAQVDLLRAAYGIEPGEKDLSTFPLFALFGPALGMASIVPDMDASRPAQADPARLAQAMEDHQATNLFASPAIIEILGRHGEAHGLRFPSLRRVISAGAPATLPSLARFQGLLPEGVEVFPSYGATEALPLTTIGTKELLETAPQTDAGAGVCVGRPLPGVELRVIRITDEPIAAWSDDLVLPEGETGEVTARGPMVSRAYFNRPESNAQAKVPAEGDAFYHRMGDLGYFDAQGRLWMCGRKAHRVTTRDGDLYTIPCERIFNTHPGVRRTALVGIGPKGDQQPVLFVERDPAVQDIPEAALRMALLEMAQDQPMTRAIATVLFRRQFPVAIRHNAKIFREKLAEAAERELR